MKTQGATSNDLTVEALATRFRRPVMAFMLRRIGDRSDAEDLTQEVAFGTDSGVSPHGDNAKEFALLVQAGLSPIEAIEAATIGAAHHLGIADEAGRIAVGMLAILLQSTKILVLMSLNLREYTSS